MIKALLLDFDGTLVTEDILDVVCEIAGKKEESVAINQAFHAGTLIGLAPLISRINLLNGVTLSQIDQKLSKNSYLMPGVKELISYCKKNSIITIISSGNILPILSFYQQKLGVDYIVGTNPEMDGEKIIGISEERFKGVDFKVTGVVKMLESLSIDRSETVVIGDSPADKILFDYAWKSIAINPKNGVEKHADFVIKDSLIDAIAIIEGLA